MPTCYRIYLNRVIEGPYNLDELLNLKNLTKETLVCEVGDLEWEPLRDCRAIQQQLAMQPLKWGAVQQTLMSASASAPENRGLMRTVSTSGDFVQRPTRPVRAVQTSPSKPAAAETSGLLSRIFTYLNGSGQ